jgi:hypothetical protein
MTSRWIRTLNSPTRIQTVSNPNSSNNITLIKPNLIRLQIGWNVKKVSLDSRSVINNRCQTLGERIANSHWWLMIRREHLDKLFLSQILCQTKNWPLKLLSPSEGKALVNLTIKHVFKVKCRLLIAHQGKDPLCLITLSIELTSRLE